jgi:hypothetical protein
MSQESEDIHTAGGSLKSRMRWFIHPHFNTSSWCSSKAHVTACPYLYIKHALYVEALWLYFSHNRYAIFLLRCSPTLTQSASLLRSLDHTQLDTHTLSRTPLNEWSLRRRGCYLHNTQEAQKKNIHAASGNRIRETSNQDAADGRPPGSAHAHLLAFM